MKLKIPENVRLLQNKVSVIVCARNEQHNLPGLFESLENQETDGFDVEFIIVDDRSEDNTARMIEDQQKKNGHFKVIHIEDRIPGFAPKKRAIDCAIKIAHGEIILLTDADGRPQKQWIKQMLAYFNQGADMVIGYAPYNVVRQDNIARKMLALEYFSIAMVAASTTALGYPVTCVGTNMAYRKKLYQEIGGFGKYKAFISGDDDLFLTLVREQKRYKIQYAVNPACHVYNAPPKTWSQFINQRLRYASKGFSYPFKVTLGLSLYVIFNLLFPMGIILGIIQTTTILPAVLILIMLKSAFEYKYIRKAAGIMGDLRFTNYYFITSILHIAYVLFFGIFGQLKFFKWTEKKAEHGILENAGNA